jgi:hypothetical protein
MEQSCAGGVFSHMTKVRSLIPRIADRQSEMLREKLSDYVAALLEKNAARLSKYEKAQEERELRTD